jgi:hypothetical protein
MTANSKDKNLSADTQEVDPTLIARGVSKRAGDQ